MASAVASVGVTPQGIVTRTEWPQLFLRILIVLSVFESDRSNMIFSSVIARFKDVDIILFFLSMLLTDRARFQREFFLKNSYGWLFIYVVLSFPISFYSSQTNIGQLIQLDTSFAWAVYLRMLYFCLLMYFLPRFLERYPTDAIKLVHLFAGSCIVFVLFNTVAYFYHFPFVVLFRPQVGRISNGYPTSDALMLGFSLVAIALVTVRTRWPHFIMMVTLVIGIAANLTISGAVCLLALGFLYLLLNMRQRPLFVFILLCGAALAIALTAYAAYQLILTYSPVDLKTTLKLVEIKLETSQTTNQGTFVQRIDQFRSIFHLMENGFDYLFGLGCYFGFIEIQYLHVFAVWGGVGLTLFVFTLYQNFISCHPQNRTGALYINLVWWISGMVLITTYLFPLFVPFALLVALSQRDPVFNGAKRHSIQPSVSTG